MIDALHNPYVIAALVVIGTYLVFGRGTGCALLVLGLMCGVIYLVLAYFLIFCIVLFILMLIGSIMVLTST